MRQPARCYLAPLLLVALAARGSEASKRVRVEGRQLLVDERPFYIKGICYSPTPINESVYFAPYGDYFTADYSFIWLRDLPLMAAMGANVIRTYGWQPSNDHTAFLDAARAHGESDAECASLSLSLLGPPAQCSQAHGSARRSSDRAGDMSADIALADLRVRMLLPPRRRLELAAPLPPARPRAHLPALPSRVATRAIAIAPRCSAAQVST